MTATSAVPYNQEKGVNAMLEEKDLQAIAELIDEKIKLQTRIKALEDDMAILKPAVAYLSEQVAELKKAQKR